MGGILFAWLFKRPVAWAAMLFVALSVFVNIIVFSVCDGMMNQFVGMVLDQVPDLSVAHYDREGFRNSRWEEDDFRKSIQEVSHGGTVMYELRVPGIIRNVERDATTGGVIRGVSHEGFIEVIQPREPYVDKSLQPADIAAAFAPGRFPRVIISRRMADEIGLKINMIVELIASVPAPIGSSVASSRTKRMSVEVGRVVRFPGQVHNFSVFLSLMDMQKFMNRKDDWAEVSEVHIRLKQKFSELSDAGPILKNIEKKGDELRGEFFRMADEEYGKYRIRTPYKNLSFFGQVYSEMMMVKTIVSFVILLAGCAIFLMVHLMMKGKVRTLGLLMAMGVSRLRMFVMVLLFGVALSAIGGALGWAGGYIFMLNIQPIHDAVIIDWFELTGIFDQYNFSKFPNAYSHLLGGVLSLGAIVLGSMAAFLPAFFASRLTPASVLKNE